MTSTKTICKDLVKQYCASCSFAGFHFIADETKHWTERILWVVFVVLSWYGSALLIIAAWEAFVLSPISFGVETVYIDWDTKMPAVAVCERGNENKIYNVSDTLTVIANMEENGVAYSSSVTTDAVEPKSLAIVNIFPVPKIWTPEHLLDLEDALKEIAYYRGWSRVLISYCYSHPEPDINCPLSNYSYYASLVRSSCDKILANCSYNNNAFACCKYFLPIETDMGTCFIINSIQTKKQNPYPMVRNIKNQHGTLKFVVRITSTIYTLGEDEVPTLTTSLSSTLATHLGNSYRRILSVRNIENDPLISETSSEQRACRFHHENENGLYPHYSYSACTVLCRKREQLKLCHCNDHFMPNTNISERCNISGMHCLNSMLKSLTILKPSWAQRPGLICNCVPSCDATEITIINDFSTALKGKANKKRTPIEIVLAALSSERFKRNVVRSRLDLVVSVGGTAGLFVGASILSFVELIFFFTVRLFNNIWLKRKEKVTNNTSIVEINKEFQKLKIRLN